MLENCWAACGVGLIVTHVEDFRSGVWLVRWSWNRLGRWLVVWGVHLHRINRHWPGFGGGAFCRWLVVRVVCVEQSLKFIIMKSADRSSMVTGLWWLVCKVDGLVVWFRLCGAARWVICVEL